MVELDVLVALEAEAVSAIAHLAVVVHFEVGHDGKVCLVESVVILVVCVFVVIGYQSSVSHEGGDHRLLVVRVIVHEIDIQRSHLVFSKRPARMREGNSVAEVSNLEIMEYISRPFAFRQRERQRRKTGKGERTRTCNSNTHTRQFQHLTTL